MKLNNCKLCTVIQIPLYNYTEITVSKGTVSLNKERVLSKISIMIINTRLIYWTELEGRKNKMMEAAHCIKTYNVLFMTCFPS